MQDNQFYEYASSMLVAAGHMITPSPMYVNHSSNKTLYIDSKKNVIISSIDRALLSSIDNVSLLMEVKWAGVVDELTEKVQFYSVTVNFSESSRSQEVADIHHLLQKFWSNNHSIVLFKNKNHFVFSFADDTKSHILSDWFEISDDYDDVVERFAIENMSLHSCDEYFEDLIYAIAREYYVHPISLEEASYGMMPIDMMVPKLVTEGSYIYDDEITKEDIKTAIRDNLSYYENMYGYDYVAVRYEGTDDAVSYRNITDEIERISFELELIGENEEQFLPDMEFNDDFDEEYDEIDEFEDDEDIDPAIYDDPILMVKWLESRQKIADEEESQDEVAPSKRVTHTPKPRAPQSAPTKNIAPPMDVVAVEKPVVSSDVAFNDAESEALRLAEDAKRKRAAAEEKRGIADIKRVESERESAAYTALVQQEKKRREQAKEAMLALERSNATANQLGIEAEQKRLFAKEKRELADKKRQEAIRLATEYDNLVHIETQRRLDAEAQRQAQEEAKRVEAERREKERLEAERKAREEAERRQLLLDELLRNHNIEVSSVRKKYDTEILKLESEIKTVQHRLVAIEARLPQLNFLQFTEKKNLRAEHDTLTKKQEQLNAQTIKLRVALEKELELENQHYLDSVANCESSFG